MATRWVGPERRALRAFKAFNMVPRSGGAETGTVGLQQPQQQVAGHARKEHATRSDVDAVWAWKFGAFTRITRRRLAAARVIKLCCAADAFLHFLEIRCHVVAKEAPVARRRRPLC